LTPRRWIVAAYGWTLLRNALLVDCFFLLKDLRGKVSIGSKKGIPETLEHFQEFGVIQLLNNRFSKLIKEVATLYFVLLQQFSILTF
jgi:hypothetical protein